MIIQSRTLKTAMREACFCGHEEEGALASDGIIRKGCRAAGISNGLWRGPLIWEHMEVPQPVEMEVWLGGVAGQCLGASICFTETLYRVPQKWLWCELPGDYPPYPFLHSVNPTEMLHFEAPSRFALDLVGDGFVLPRWDWSWPGLCCCKSTYSENSWILFLPISIHVLTFICICSKAKFICSFVH